MEGRAFKWEEKQKRRDQTQQSNFRPGHARPCFVNAALVYVGTHTYPDLSTDISDMCKGSLLLRSSSVVLIHGYKRGACVCVCHWRPSNQYASAGPDRLDGCVSHTHTRLSPHLPAGLGMEGKAAQLWHHQAGLPPFAFVPACLRPGGPIGHVTMGGGSTTTLLIPFHFRGRDRDQGDILFQSLTSIVQPSERTCLIRSLTFQMVSAAHEKGKLLSLKIGLPGTK